MIGAALLGLGVGFALGWGLARLELERSSGEGERLLDGGPSTALAAWP